MAYAEKSGDNSAQARAAGALNKIGVKAIYCDGPILTHKDGIATEHYRRQENRPLVFVSGVIDKKHNIDDYVERYQKLNDYGQEFRNDVRSFGQGNFKTNSSGTRNTVAKRQRSRGNVGVVESDNRNGRATDDRESFSDFEEEQRAGIVFDGEKAYKNYYDENGNFVSTVRQGTVLCLYMVLK